LDCTKGNNIQNEERTPRVVEDYFAFIDCMKESCIEYIKNSKILIPMAQINANGK
jgi:hypothetical protein